MRAREVPYAEFAWQARPLTGQARPVIVADREPADDLGRESHLRIGAKAT
jgi:hypothetical protein